MRAGVIAHCIGCLPCTWLTWVQFLASHIQPCIQPARVTSEFRAWNNPWVPLDVAPPPKKKEHRKWVLGGRSKQTSSEKKGRMVFFCGSQKSCYLQNILKSEWEFPWKHRKGIPESGDCRCDITEVWRDIVNGKESSLKPDCTVGWLKVVTGVMLRWGPISGKPWIPNSVWNVGDEAMKCFPAGEWNKWAELF